MALTLTSIRGGLLVQLDSADAFIIDTPTVLGICRALVNGRDIEDALAPVQVVESIIGEKLEADTWEHGLDGTFLYPRIPEDSWLSDVDFPTFVITPIQAALGLLDFFGGGETTTVALEEV